MAPEQRQTAAQGRTGGSQAACTLTDREVEMESRQGTSCNGRSCGGSCNLTVTERRYVVFRAGRFDESYAYSDADSVFVVVTFIAKVCDTQ